MFSLTTESLQRCRADVFLDARRKFFEGWFEVRALVIARAGRMTLEVLCQCVALQCSRATTGTSSNLAREAFFPPDAVAQRGINPAENAVISLHRRVLRNRARQCTGLVLEHLAVQLIQHHRSLHVRRQPIDGIRQGGPQPLRHIMQLGDDRIGLDGDDEFHYATIILLYGCSIWIELSVMPFFS